MSRRQRVAEDRLITVHDIFDGIFCLLIMRGYISIDPDTRYYEACEAVSKKVEEVCNEPDSGKITDFIIRCDLHGTSETAHRAIMSWIGFGAHVEIGGRRGYIFDLGEERAEDMLQRQIEATGFTREFYEELTKIFLEIYNG